jgi:hypothetical protein
MSGAEGGHELTAFSSDEAADCEQQDDSWCTWSIPSLTPVSCGD